ncbi:MAG: hypothetical protein HYV07_23535 [Deltaproteobacteria bacterium]|nr:hypothetical protein [Deltaproteobacteria bacterium]
MRRTSEVCDENAPTVPSSAIATDATRHGPSTGSMGHSLKGPLVALVEGTQAQPPGSVRRTCERISSSGVALSGSSSSMEPSASKVTARTQGGIGQESPGTRTWLFSIEGTMQPHTPPGAPRRRTVS